MAKECKNCDDNCSYCSIYLAQNGIPMGYGGEAPREAIENQDDDIEAKYREFYGLSDTDEIDEDQLVTFDPEYEERMRGSDDYYEEPYD